MRVCIQECVRAGAAARDGQLAAAVLADELAGELLAHLEPGGSGGEMPRAAQRVAARARVLAAVRAHSACIAAAARCTTTGDDMLLSGAMDLVLLGVCGRNCVTSL